MDDATSVLDLPDDPALLKRIIAQRDTTIAQIKHEAAERIEAMTLQHKAELDAILRRFYGPRSEKFDPRQLLIFGIAVADQVPVDPRVVEAESGQKLATRRINHHKHGRGRLPGHLPRIEIVHDLSDQQKTCPCCGEQRVCIGSEISEQLEYVPASLKVLRHVRRKYACAKCGRDCLKCDCSSQIEMAAKPAQPIEKGLPGPGLLACVITSKLGDHLPLYRLERIFARHGVEIARSTMCAWMLAASELVKPLIDLMTGRVKQSQVIHTDETRVPVQDEAVKGQCKSGRIWTYIGDESNPYVAYAYTPDRTRAGPQRFLDDYKGYLQADAYGGYDGIYHKGDVIEVACWAHARRKFFDARDTDGRRSAEMLELVRQLYAVEDQARSMDHDARRQLRQSRSVPILAKIKAWLDAEQQLVLPRSPMAAAITYTLNQWEALNRYVEQGYLNIDNNAAERALKRVAIGRKNWLFAGHDEAGASHARLWTLIASAERHGVDPQKYLTSVLATIGQTKLSDLEQFLPDVWKQDDSREPLSPPPHP
ncbi:MAG: IS66 family transposase [Chloroflexi bacterium]|nr:IS66 family transposase [Chloroflexota bacterium]